MNSRPFTILIVSPDRSLLRRLSKFLEVFGYDVRQATDDRQALAAAQAARPDYLILDASHGDPIDLQLGRQIRRIWPQGYTYAMLLSERPEVADVTAGLEAGFDDFLVAPLVFGELLARLRAGARVIEFERRLADQTGLELVTGLPHKESLAAQLAARSQGAKGTIGWMALFDLDYFFRIADQFGRPEAQTLLRDAAHFIQSRCAAPAFAGSLADDRVAVLLPPQAAEAAVAWADGTLTVLAAHPFKIADQPMPVTASCGMTEVSAGESLDTILVRASRSLQLAKASGRNCVATSREVETEAESWAAFAADGKLFQSTAARDVMQPCPLLLHADESVEQANALLELTGLAVAPVVDNEGKLLGTITHERLAAARLRGDAKPRESGSVRLVRHLMTADVTKFEESTPLARLLEYFTGEAAPLAIIVRDRRPRGIVTCQGLAALNEKLATGHFSPAQPRTGSSADLLVPELALAE